MPSVKIEDASWVITLDRRRRVLRDASILIDDGVIRAIGKADVLKRERAELVLNAKGCVVTPGFINAHMHISYAHAFRGIFPDDLPQQAYLQRTFQLQSAMKVEEEYYTMLLGIVELVKNGCTCLLDPGTITNLERAAEAFGLAGIRAIVGREVVDRPNPLGLEVLSTEEAIKRMEEVLRRFNGTKVKGWCMPFAPNYCSDELLLAAKELADRYKVGLTLHVSSSEEMAEDFERERDRRVVEHLAKLGVLGENVLLAHALALSEGEVELLALHGAKVVHCPTSALRGAGTTKLGRFPEMLGKGICVCLGSDSANASYSLDPLRLIYLAAVLYKDARQDRRVMPAETALEMGSLNGARALLMEREIGSLEVGKRADIVIFDTKRAEWRSLFYPINNMVYSADGRSVRAVLIDGRIVVEEGRVTFVDEMELCEKVQGIGEGLLSRVGISFDRRWSLE